MALLPKAPRPAPLHLSGELCEARVVHGAALAARGVTSTAAAAPAHPEC